MTSEMVHLGDLCEILDSQRRPITKRDRDPGPYPYLGATGAVDFVNDYIFDEPLVLLGEDGAKWGAGEKSAFAVTGKCWVNNHAHVLRPDREKIRDQWLIEYLNATDLDEFITGATVQKLNQAMMRSIPIPLPSLEEQDATLRVLDAALTNIDELIRVRSDLCSQIIDLGQSVARRAIPGEGWTTGALDSVASVSYGERVTRNRDGGTMYPVYGGGGATFSIDRSNRRDCFIVSRFAMSEHCVRYVDGEFFLNDSGLTVETKNPGVLQQDFLDETLLSRQHEIYALSAGAAQQNLDVSAFRQLTIAWPAVALQEEIVLIIRSVREKVNEIESLISTELLAMSELRNSVLSCAFRGEL